MHTTVDNEGAFGEHVRTPVKDFITLGLVFTENQLTTNYLAGNVQGHVITYQELLKEAQKLEADAIINVVIDKKTQSVGKVTTETWYGSALAIRYTDTLTETGTTTVTTEGRTTTTQTTTIYFNDDSSNGSADGGQRAPAIRLPSLGVRQ